MRKILFLYFLILICVVYSSPKEKRLAACTEIVLCLYFSSGNALLIGKRA